MLDIKEWKYEFSISFAINLPQSILITQDLHVM